jgi:DNA-binding transcriptional LysR family regulator
MISPEYLREFLAVAKNMSFTKAAEELFVTQSVLSRHISALESYLGVPLLNRKNRNVSVTTAGRVLCEQGPDIISRLEALEASVARAATGEENALTVASMPEFADILFPIYREFCAQNPDVRFNIIHRDSAGMISCIERESADIGFMILPDEDSARTIGGNLVIQTAFKDEICAVVSEWHPLAGEERVDVRRLCAGRVEATDGFIADLFQRRCQEAGLEAGQACPEIASTHESVMLDVNYKGAAYLHSYRVTRLHNAFQSGLVRLRLSGADSSYSVVSVRRAGEQKGAAERFMQILEDSMGSTYLL